jgi:hypothetical protein
MAIIERENVGKGTSLIITIFKLSEKRKTLEIPGNKK